MELRLSKDISLDFVALETPYLTLLYEFVAHKRLFWQSKETKKKYLFFNFEV